jgi:hypothetical protein
MIHEGEISFARGIYKTCLANLLGGNQYANIKRAYKPLSDT